MNRGGGRYYLSFSSRKKEEGKGKKGNPKSTLQKKGKGRESRQGVPNLE